MTDKQYDEIVRRTLDPGANSGGDTSGGANATQRLLNVCLQLEARIIAVEAQLAEAKANTAALIDAVNGASSAK